MLNHSQLLTEFVNAQLSPLDIYVDDLIGDLESGVNLLILVGCIGNFYVPIQFKGTDDQEEFDATATTSAGSSAVKKLDNVKLALQLMNVHMSIDISQLNGK